MAKIKFKTLEEYLQCVEGFENPKILLEQYSTPPHIASCMLYNIQTRFDDIENKIVGDLGCGCGILTIGSQLLGANYTIGFEFDVDAIKVFRRNIAEMEISSVDCVSSDVNDLKTHNFNNFFDTIIMNPPFGTKRNSGIDIEFLKIALGLTNNTVYSLHKSSTRDFIKRKSQEWNTNGEVIAELKYNIDNTYAFHKSNSTDIRVDFWRFEVKNKKQKGKKFV